MLVKCCSSTVPIWAYSTMQLVYHCNRRSCFNESSGWSTLCWLKSSCHESVNVKINLNKSQTKPQNFKPSLALWCVLSAGMYVAGRHGAGRLERCVQVHQKERLAVCLSEDEARVHLVDRWWHRHDRQGNALRLRQVVSDLSQTNLDLSLLATLEHCVSIFFKGSSPSAQALNATLCPTQPRPGISRQNSSWPRRKRLRCLITTQSRSRSPQARNMASHDLQI